MKAVVAALSLVFSIPGMAAPAPVEVMVLGSYHFANPGLDKNNIKVDTVLTPDRQRQLDRVARAVARFRPTRVMVEMQGKGPDLAIAEYDRFDDAMLAKDANEIVQIGYRTARLAGVKTVNGIDEQPGPGEPDYFPFDKVDAAAKQFGQTAELAATNVGVAAWLKDFSARQQRLTVGQSLIAFNTPGSAVTGMDSYYGVLPIGDHDNQAGADLNAMWYLRNAKIFAKLMSVAKPGDRVLVVYGSGHNFWLRHFAGLTPGYRSVDPLPFLKAVK
ncbi:DUF5694 domain-containing protein [Sandarakinorhabdus sp. DWP1-3-1]|uniref:DUF5694 domain-containing protein n=1 Tax=Sandarakinorhabdus sp. DWP1-3-1 TaxID=2804627 RepID=UPI003CF46924